MVSGPFGVFVADPIQKVQFVFITECRDEVSRIANVGLGISVYQAVECVVGEGDNGSPIPSILALANPEN